MIVSWNWLQDYVDLKMSAAELEHRLSMSGLNHEETKDLGDDLAIDLEVTSNRPDCLGHLGVAREIAVLWETPLKTPKTFLAAAGDMGPPTTSLPPVSDLTRVSIECARLCPRYTARVIWGVKVGPSPDWMAHRLQTIGVACVNNIVDITNYVLMECGQPLHAFDFAKLKGPEIIVRTPRAGEKLEAIDHNTYELSPEMCVIADAQSPVAIGGVMGGALTEISPSTTDLLIESAEFDRLSIRNTGRKLTLTSDSSYRFERGVDPEGVDWASRRCCQLILEIAGGELAPGVIDAGRSPRDREPIVLRLSQLPRILGIEIDETIVRRILIALGGELCNTDPGRVSIIPPSWRRDLTREIDLIEEVARIHGYEAIPEDIAVPMAASARSDFDRVLEIVRRTLTGAGYDEVITHSVVGESESQAFLPWRGAAPITCNTPLVRGADHMRRSLTPSLLTTRRFNEAGGNWPIELFETAKVYLPRQDELPTEQWTLALAGGGDFYDLKGVLQALLEAIRPNPTLKMAPAAMDLLDRVKSAELQVDGRTWGYLGELSAGAQKQFGLRSSTCVAELNLELLPGIAELVPQYSPPNLYPEITQDLNFILQEAVRWADLEITVRTAAGELLESMEYRETFRDPQRDGANCKRILFSFTLRAADRTLTGEEATAVRESIVSACQRRHNARLVG